MNPFPSTDYKQVHGLSRGLAVLKALNQVAGGHATPSDLARLTGLHRTTVRRLLETLVAEGYVRRSASDGSFRLERAVRDLCDGFCDEQWVSAVATPVMGQLLKDVVWPSDLTTLEGDALVVRETTHRFSPLSVHRAMVGRRMPLLSTAAGRAYLAFSHETEREPLLRLAATAPGEDEPLQHQTALQQRLFDTIRRDGYATNDGDWRAEAHIAAIAMPIRPHGRLLACLSVVYLRRAMRPQEAVERYLGALERSVRTVEAAIEASGG